MSKVIGYRFRDHQQCGCCDGRRGSYVIPTAEGSRLCHRWFAFNKNGERLVGQTAKRQAVVNPENTVYSISASWAATSTKSRLSGAWFHTRWSRGSWGYARVKFLQQGVNTAHRNLSHDPGKIEKPTRAYLGEPVNQARDHRPAYSMTANVRPPKTPVKLPAWRCCVSSMSRLLPHWRMDWIKRRMRRFWVFDLGGGTFDVSILDVGGGVLKSDLPNGDTHLGWR